MTVRLVGYTRELALKSVGKGWAPIINRLFDIKPPQTVVIQVKEKFGGLRFYVDHSTIDYEKEIRKAENESFTVCEDCGSTVGVSIEPLFGRSWVLTLCSRCRQEAKETLIKNQNE